MKNRKRFLVGKMQRQSQRDRITHEEVAQAIRRFQDQGGLIHELPAQREQYRPKIGTHLGSAFESVLEY
jgi:hypothetical protein